MHTDSFSHYYLQLRPMAKSNVLEHIYNGIFSTQVHQNFRTTPQKYGQTDTQCHWFSYPV